MFQTKVERIQRDIETLARYSSVEGIGCTRYTYTKEYAQARDYVVSEMKAAGLTVREDAVGTIVGRLEGKNPDAPVLMTGSHLDTVKTGGRFDGIAGVCAALETARVLHEEGFVPECPVEFVAMPEEEGARFGGGLFASRAMCGKLYENELETYKDADGVSMAKAMKAYGLDPSRAGEAERKPGEVGTFLELHIEQGPVLENEKIQVGVVEAIVGLKCMIVTVRGRSDHAGSTPMNMRADAMLASAKAMVAGTQRALDQKDGTVVTFGRLEIKPGAFNIVANETDFYIDCRSRSMESVDAVLEEIEASLKKSAEENPGLSYHIEEKLRAYPVLMKPSVQELLEKKAEEAGISTRRILSGAGHDAMIMGSLCDVAMVFVPSKDGRSHVPEEWTDYEDLRNGAEVLCRCVRELASCK
ncbi:MAG: Zn-dependent hydrolase [Lachnospiraceae bacterium]|nr:Zn-dependent hydrolase [Lachnospiraceae bacterium]MCI8915011.1 Zn-dependent hydrolase [Lawsonibacter sp.]